MKLQASLLSLLRHNAHGMQCYNKLWQGGVVYTILEYKYLFSKAEGEFFLNDSAKFNICKALEAS